LSFKHLFFLFIFIHISSCGVKGPPKAPAGTSVPSFVNQYMVTNSSKEVKQDDSKEEQEEESTKKQDKK
jgi:predicted small lipoprotein YifL